MFAALSDTATSGENSVETGAEVSAVDILIAPLTQDASGTWTCGEFSDDLTSGLFALEAEDFDPAPSASFCIKSNGTNMVIARTSVFDIADVDVACTGDEMAFDPTCGPGTGPEDPEQPGELGKYLLLTYYTDVCHADPAVAAGTFTLQELAAVPFILGAIKPQSYRCFTVELSLAPGVDWQAVQSDRVTWRFRWDATLAPTP